VDGRTGGYESAAGTTITRSVERELTKC